MHSRVIPKDVGGHEPRERVTRGKYYPHIVGNTRSRGVNLPMSNVTEEAFIMLLDTIPHSVWKHKACTCSDCRPDLAEVES